MRIRSRWKQLQQFWKENEWLGVLCIFYLSVIVFSAWVSPTSFTDPDAFYHMKVTEILIQNHGPITNFVWLPFTTLHDAYVDHHLLYHIFLIPFFYLLGTVMGMKVATFLLAASTVTLFYIALKLHRVHYAFAFAFLLLFTEGFAFRMALSKAPSFSFLFLFGLFILLTKRKWVALIPLSFLYVWSYGGFILAFVLGCAYTAAYIFHAVLDSQRAPSMRTIKKALLPVSLITIGLLCGLLIHPSFPDHLHFYYQQLIQIGVINYQDKIGVGGEWYPIPPLELFGGTAQLTLLLITGFVAWLKTVKKQSIFSTIALAMTLLFCIATLKSQRYIEYYVPWGYLFAVLAWHYSGWLKKVPHAVKQARTAIGGDSFQKVAAGLMIAYVIFIAGVLVVLNGTRTLKSLRAGIPLERYEDSGAWLREHANKGDIVFHSDWDDFPILFFQVARGRYIAGLDPTFLYNKNQELYWKWADITTGKQKDNLIHIIGRDFNARFVFIENDHKDMIENIRADGHFIEVYSDEEATIFRVPRTLPRQEESASDSSSL